MTDNAKAYRQSRIFQATLKEICCRQLFTPTHHPRLNGKVERFNQTLLEEWPASVPTSATRPGWTSCRTGYTATTTTAPTPPSAASLP